MNIEKYNRCIEKRKNQTKTSSDTERSKSHMEVQLKTISRQNALFGFLIRFKRSMIRYAIWQKSDWIHDQGKKSKNLRKEMGLESKYILWMLLCAFPFLWKKLGSGGKGNWTRMKTSDADKSIKIQIYSHISVILKLYR